MGDLSKTEAEVYDRQLRVWGVEVQKRLRSARVLIIGGNGLAAEVAKNISLAGVGVLHLMDSNPLASKGTSNFLAYIDFEDRLSTGDKNLALSVAEASAINLRKMNPMVTIEAIPSSSPSRELVQNYDLLLIVGRPLGSLVIWDTLCRDNNVAFYAAASRGPHAFFFADLGTHTYQPKEIAGVKPPPQTKAFCRLTEALQGNWKSINPKKSHKLVPVLLLCAAKESDKGDFLPPEDVADLLAFGQNLARAQAASPSIIDKQTLEEYLSGSEDLAAVNSIVGGVLANEIIKAVSKNQDPLQNTFLYSLNDGSGLVENLIGPELQAVSPKHAAQRSALASKI